MWLDAALAYLHFTAVFVYFAFLSIEIYLVRLPVGLAQAASLRRASAWYWGSVAAVIATGTLRATLGAKGLAFYTASWPLLAKLVLLAFALAWTIQPNATQRRWAHDAAGDPAWRAPEAERATVRRQLLGAIHVAALVPLAAVLMARGLS